MLSAIQEREGEERHEGCGGMWLAGCALVTVEGDWGWDGTAVVGHCRHCIVGLSRGGES